MINVQEGNLSRLFSQHKANCLDEFHILHEECHVNQLDMSNVGKSVAIALPNCAEAKFGFQRVEDKVETQHDLQDIVDEQKLSQFERLTRCHKSAGFHIRLI